jgi:transcriptional regulator with XRE-family HTH domain
MAIAVWSMSVLPSTVGRREEAMDGLHARERARSAVRLTLVGDTRAYGLNPLRRARQARGLTLADIAKETRLSQRILSKIELGDFESLPIGLFARAHVRAYAAAVGLDGDEVVARLADRLPTPPDPLLALKSRERLRWAETHPAQAAIVDAMGIIGVRLARELRAMGQLFVLKPRAAWWRPRVAAAVDGLTLAALSATLIHGAAAITGSRVDALLGHASMPLGIALAIMVLLYFATTSGITGRTPGGVVAGCEPAAHGRPLSPREITDRALRTLLAEASMLGTLLASRYQRATVTWLKPR